MDQVMTSASNNAAIIPEVWSSRFYEVLLAELVFASVVSKDYEGEIQDLGETVNISSAPEFSDGEVLDEDQAASASAITFGTQQLVINHRVVKDYIVTKKAILQSIPHMDKLRELAIYAVMKKIEKIIIAATIPSAAAPDHSIGYVSGTTLGLADMLAAKELLDEANVPAADRHMVLGSAQTNDIFNIVGFTSNDFLMSGAPLQSGQVPAGLLGFAPHMTTLVANVAHLFHKSYMNMASQQGMAVAVFDLGVEGKRAARVNVDTLFGLKQTDDKRVVTIT